MKRIKTALKQRNRSLTFRFVLIVGLLVMTVLVLVASFLVAILFRQANQERLQVLQNSLSHTDVLFSQYLTSMEAYCQELYSTDTIRSIRASDMLTPAEQARSAQELQNKLRNAPYIHSVYIVNQSGTCNFHTTNSNKFLEDPGSRLPELLAAQKGSTLPFIWTAESRHPASAPVPLLTMYMQAAPIGAAYYTGTVVVNCDLSWLSHALFSSLEDTDLLQYYVLDLQGRVVVHSKEQYFGEDMSAIPAISEILSGVRTIQRENLDGIRYEIMAISSQYPGYYLVVQSVYQPQSKLAAEILLAFSLAVLVLCTLCMCVSYMIGRKVFSPLSTLISTIRRDEMAEMLDSYSGDELQYLNRYYHSVSAYVERLKSRDEKNLIVKNLLLGNRVQPMLLQKGILYPDTDYCAILIYMMEDTEWENLSDYYQWHSSICEAISLSFRDVGQCSWFEMDFHRMLFLLTGTPDKQCSGWELQPQVTNVLQGMMDRLFSNRVLVYVSFSCSDQSDLLQLYRKMDGHLRTALCLSRDTDLTKKICLFSSLDETHIEPDTLQPQFETIKQQVQQEDRDAFLNRLNGLLDAMSGLLWEDFTKHLENLAQALAAMGEAISDHASTTSKYRLLIEKIKAARKRQVLLDCFLLLYDEIVFQRQKINAHSAIHTIDYAVTYLQNNYADSQLNMAALARKMNVSPSYFGKLFHDYTEKSVSEYLTEIRMEHARELLRDTERTVTQVASDVGYPNAGYFSTKFKQYFGVSPSSLRNYSAVADAEQDI